jgi:SAM-dependent methyltransferase
LCQRTVRKPLTSDSATTCIDAGAIERSSAPLSTVQHRWQRPAAPNLLPSQARDAYLAAHEERGTADAGRARGVGSVQGRAVADLGCGPGQYAREFIARGARRVVGVDGSAEMIPVGQPAGWLGRSRSCPRCAGTRPAGRRRAGRCAPCLRPRGTTRERVRGTLGHVPLHRTSASTARWASDRLGRVRRSPPAAIRVQRRSILDGLINEYSQECTPHGLAEFCAELRALPVQVPASRSITDLAPRCIRDGP